jgi:hypothetical protein
MSADEYRSVGKVSSANVETDKYICIFLPFLNQMFRPTKSTSAMYDKEIMINEIH